MVLPDASVLGDQSAQVVAFQGQRGHHVNGRSEVRGWIRGRQSLNAQLQECKDKLLHKFIPLWLIPF
jgi:hypothetical protein